MDVGCDPSLSSILYENSDDESGVPESINNVQNNQAIFECRGMKATINKPSSW